MVDLGADAVRVEELIARLERAEHVEEALASAREIATRAPEKSLLRADALYAAGLAEHRLRQEARAVAALTDASAILRGIPNAARSAAVSDALGRVLASSGRLDAAIHHHALALADKAAAGDRAGIAASLVHLGRVQLQAARTAEAIACFARARVLATELGDTYVAACALDCLGEAHADAGNWNEAVETLRAAVEMCRAGGHAYVEFFSHATLARAHAALGRPDLARRELAAASELAGARGLRDLAGALSIVEGRVLVAEDRAREALAPLRAALEAFAETARVDDEITARIALADALLACGEAREAERVLAAGLPIARREGRARHLRSLSSALARSGSTGVDERGSSIQVESAGAVEGYLLREVIGSGSFGEVFRAYDALRGFEVAFKRLRLRRLYDAERTERVASSVRRELEAAARVRHPGVARVHAVGRTLEGDAYVVQELVRGRSLRAVMQAEPAAAPRRVRDLLALLADALTALHAAGVVHRDLKPENVLLRDDGMPVLIDFGIAQLDGAGALAVAGLAGTLAYMAPEQMRGGRVDARADLYALGVIAYEWLAGVLPVAVDAPEAASLERAARSVPRPLRELRPDVPEDLAALVHALLEKKPRKRPASAALLRETLAPILL